MVPIEVKVLPVLLQAGPAHRIDDRERAVLTARNRMPNANIVEVKVLFEGQD
jgi:hypothetical protein